MALMEPASNPRVASNAPRRTLSVAIIAKNEQANLGRTLRSVAWADEIVVVDSGSTDETVGVARSYNARVFVEEWRGYAGQKNFALAQCTRDWVLSLDADEVVSAELQEQIARVLGSPGGCDAYWCNRRNAFLGRWLRHGGMYPDRKLRLFKRGAAQFEDRAVHENVRYAGPTLRLKGDLLHDAYPTLELYLEHMNRYSTLGAEAVRAKSGRAGFLRDVLLRPALTFVYNYGVRGGFLDGREGLLFHLYHGMYVSWKYAKVWQRLKG